MDHTATVAILTANIGSLPSKDQVFGQSLLTQLANKGSLSSSQWYWVGKLAARATEPKVEPVTITVGDFGGVIDLFNKAKQKLKFPKIALQLEDGRPVVLTVAGAASKAPGTVNITDGKPFGSNTWYGRVTPSGAWEPSRKADDATQVSMSTLLAMLAKHPARVAAEHGKLTGNCCFCNSKLTDKRSTEIGYGTICAQNYGLPWGVQGRAGLLDKIAKAA